MAKYKQGYYTPKHPEKYVGDITKIRYMSSWELQTHQFFDNNSRVLRWASEEIAIPYISALDNKLHKYYPDYWVEYVNQDGEIIHELIEVKPAAQTKPPKRGGKYQLYEQATYIRNTCKWQAAIAWCEPRNIKFRILTEGGIFK